MKQLLALILAVAVPSAMLAGDSGYKIAYDGGSVEGAKAGTGMKLYMESGNIRLLRDKQEVVVIPAASVSEVSYGQDVHRRVGAAVAVGIFTLGAGALLALAKSKKHFIGIIWDDGNGKKGGIAFQADKSDYRGLLTGLEGITGKKAINSDTLGVKN
jgi:hypothetical protein